MRLTSPHRRTTRGALPVALAALAGVTLSACSGGAGAGAGSSASSHSSTLTIGISAAPATLNPAQLTINQALVVPFLAYDPLIYQASDGSYQPDLATEWGFVGSGNTKFHLKLRQGVTFADGSKLDAQAVKTWLEYVKSTGQNRVQTMSAINVLSPLELEIDLSAPNPDLPWLLSQNGVVGLVGSPAATQDPNSLANSTAGAGEYVLDKAATVINSNYSFTPNPKYWNKKAIQYKSVTVRVFDNPSSLLSAMQTHQVDVGVGDPTTAQTAQQAGLDVVKGEGAQVQNIWLNDRSGTLVKALGDVRVRQALNYAVDRKAIAKTLYNGYGTASDQNEVPADEGYSASNESIYSYNPQKAKQLLAEAGYANGFDMSLMCSPPNTTACNVSNAVAAYWKAIGVTTNVDGEASMSSFLPKLAAAPAAINGTGNVPTFSGAFNWFNPAGGYANPQKSTDPNLENLYHQASVAGPDQRTTLFQQMDKALVTQAWFVPLVRLDYLYYVDKSKVSGLDVSAKNSMWDPVGPANGDGWH